MMMRTLLKRAVKVNTLMKKLRSTLLIKMAIVKIFI